VCAALTDPDKLEWRARREARRVKQREANISRAEKMHLARLVTAQLLPEPSDAKLNIPSVKDKKYFIGCSGWFYWHWRDIFYPGDLPSNQWFQHYARHFDSVELNAPFYSWPTVANVKTWIRQAQQYPFVYTVKVCELITHIKRFTGTKEMIKDFGYIGDLLGERMGCFLFQLPSSFHYTPGRLKAIINQLEQGRRNVVEFRHASWWNDNVYVAFQKAGIIFCSCSGPRLPDYLVKTTDDIYIRFHGTKQWYRHDYSIEELQQWADRIHKTQAKRVWVYFNNDRNGYAIKNANILLDLLRQNGRNQQT